LTIAGHLRLSQVDVSGKQISASVWNCVEGFAIGPVAAGSGRFFVGLTVLGSGVP
jgi:hypothetical protein